MKVTDIAIEQFKKAIEHFDLPGSGIRLFAEAGCCGSTYQLRIVNHQSEGDQIVTINGVDFFIESQIAQMLNNVSIDFKEDSFKIDGLKNSGGCCK